MELKYSNSFTSITNTSELYNLNGGAAVPFGAALFYVGGMAVNAFAVAYSVGFWYELVLG